MAAWAGRNRSAPRRRARRNPARRPLPLRVRRDPWRTAPREPQGTAPTLAWGPESSPRSSSHQQDTPGAGTTQTPCNVNGRAIAAPRSPGHVSQPAQPTGLDQVDEDVPFLPLEDGCVGVLSDPKSIPSMTTSGQWSQDGQSETVSIRAHLLSVRCGCIRPTDFRRRGPRPSERCVSVTGAPRAPVPCP